MSATEQTARSARVPLWLAGVVPLALIALLIAGFVILNPIAGLREVPPVEAVAVERTVITDSGIELHVRNDGPDPVRIAQVLVNDAYRDFEITGSDPELRRLESAVIELDYPWETGLPLTFGLVTSTGVVIEHEVEAAALTPAPDASTLWIYALLGIYIGLVPVSIGLLWWPALRRVSAGWLAFFLAFTVGLLAFLLLDTIAEGIELSGETPAALNGLGLFALGALSAVVGLVALEGALRSRGADHSARGAGGLVLAYLVASGIGLHNLGEGLAVGAALAAGEAALGTFLVIGFAVHNTTEGLAIVAPLGSAEQRPSLWHFAALGAVAGLPAVLGAWGGGFAFSPAPAALAFGLAAGAIAQVIWQIGRGMTRPDDRSKRFGAAGLVVGFLVMYVTGLLT
jgi:zinc transporter, ZIP family